ncbi:MAG: hypothetical protein LC747_08055, partial [Acidobacteria bacterium]|nr:hypothetical protein [Acidobacteriota bacterium]
NRMAQLNDRASRIVFVSTRNELTAKNADFNPEIFIWRRTSSPDALPATGSFTQLTNTSGAFTFNDNPSISGDTSSDAGGEDPRSIIAFISNATVLRDASDAPVPVSNTDANAEIFVTTFNGATTTAFTQATRTRRGNLGDLVNVFNPGQHVSRDGRFVAFESTATNPGADAATNQTTSGLFIYAVASGETRTFVQIGPRALGDIGEGDVPRFPVFTGDSRQLVFTSGLNFTPGGTRVARGDATGLNSAGFIQIYAVTIPDPFTAPQSFTRLSNITSGQGAATQPFVSNTTERIVFTFNAELGGGNTDLSGEAFYLNVPPAPPASDTPASTSALTFFTGATEREVVPPPASPTPTPSPAPAATPITGLAPGMIGIVLPVGLTTQTGTSTSRVVININEGGAVRTVRSVLQIVPAQPDIFTRPDAPTRASVFNVTTGTLMGEPAEGFPVTNDVMGTARPTILAIFLTGVRNPAITRANVTVTIGDRTITGNDIQPAVAGTERAFIATDMPGVDQLNVQQRADLAGLGDQPLVVSVTVGGVTFTSRPAATAPRIRIR